VNLSILRNVGIIASGAVVAQLIGLASLPLLTRLYSPAGVGPLHL
jgi:O-antigen/teichoic acid export membrane protein